MRLRRFLLAGALALLLHGVLLCVHWSLAPPAVPPRAALQVTLRQLPAPARPEAATVTNAPAAPAPGRHATPPAQTAQRSTMPPAVDAHAAKPSLAQPQPATTGLPDTPDALRPQTASAAAPVLDLEQLRKQARVQAERDAPTRVPGLANLATPAPERKSAQEEAIARSFKPDCRTAHADKGLLAAPFLLYDAVSEDGCHW
ncbi:hypothetical protein SAMN02745857_03968 [Andreprevotia lacus DSM 23236]|uniref:Uncharacterized protein n=1 Tax=Andreprevotia lacus DSM 23236 TaxID=1121001 RepID=A0A1W1Y1J0_9NEIS|nr:hypothetical protein [Andreprevotia lacus]SMC29628.1 hypothetical protein SAMN02745857_03968 [Andreprevotia lacus DSM 23236]